jgi:hypothetical protein
MIGHHPIANGNLGHAIPDFSDNSGGFHARRKGERRLELVFTRNHQGVGEVQANGMNLNLYLARLNFRLFNLFHDQDIRISEFLTNKRFHILPTFHFCCYFEGQAYPCSKDQVNN